MWSAGVWWCCGLGGSLGAGADTAGKRRFWCGSGYCGEAAVRVWERMLRGDGGLGVEANIAGSGGLGMGRYCGRLLRSGIAAG